MMKRYLLILLALSVSLWAAPGTTQQLNLYAKVHPESVELKWMRLDYSNESTFRLYRSRADQKEELIATLRPASYSWLKEKGYDDDYIFFIYPFHDVKTTDERLDVLRSSSMRAGFRLMKIIQQNQFAKNCGLYYMDRDVTSGERYSYRVEEYDNTHKLSSKKVRLTAGEIGSQERVKWLQAVDEHESLGFNFDTSNGFGFYNLYRKLPSQKEFIRLNKLPRFVSDVKDPTRKALFHDREIAVNKSAEYYVTRVDMFGDEGPASRTVTAMRTPSKPAVNMVKNIHLVKSDRAIVLRWDKDPMVIGYDIYRGRIYQGAFTKINSEPVRSNSYTDRDFKADTNYYYYIVAHNMHGSSRPSTKVLAYALDTTPPSRPTVLRADVNGSQVQLSWKGATDKNLLGYRIYMAMDKRAQEWSMVNKVEVNATHYLHKRAKTLSRHDYYYRVTAVDRRYNESKASNIIKVRLKDTIAPTQPVLTRQITRAGEIELQWGAVHSYDLSHYNVYRIEGKMSRKLNSSPIKRTFFIDKGVKNGLNRYVVTAVDLSDNESNRTRYVEVMAQDVRPVKVTAFKAAFKKGGVALSFKVDDGDYNGFEVLRRSGEDPHYYNISGFQKGLAYFDKSAVKGQHYFYTIKAYDKSGNIIESDVAEIMTKGE